MKNLFIIAYYELKRLARNPRLMLIVLSQPIIIAIFVGLIVYHEPQDINVGLVVRNINQYSSEISEKLRNSENLIIIDYQDVEIEDIKRGEMRGFVEININPEEDLKEIHIYNDPTGKILGGVIEGEVIEASSEVSRDYSFTSIDNKVSDFEKNIGQAAAAVPEIQINKEDIKLFNINRSEATPFDLQYFDYFGSAMVVLLTILVVLNLSGMSITGERLSGTFERLFVTPYSKFQVIFGKMLAQNVVGIFIAALGIITLYLVFRISIGDIYLVILVNLLVVMTSVSLGLLISSITYTVVESVELAMYVFFISVLTTGILVPIETAYKYFVYIMKIVPFYYAVDASRRINMLDAGWEHVSSNMFILIFYFFGFFVLSVVLLRRAAK